MKLSNKAILIIIIIVATILRVYNLFEIPYTFDEFSALSRVHFNSFSELIEKGVKIDAHPAGVHVFIYYWTKLFGFTEWVLKMPFIISGIVSVYLIFLIGKKWYNETLGLISAAFLASIQFTIMYSQIARPYVSGLFFSLLMVYFWTKIMLTPQKRFYLNGALFIISAALCAYNHHFSLLFAAIVGLSGLLYIQRQYLLKYIICGVFIAVLYVPHLNIFLYQLHVGGIESWLAKPHADFFINYLGYIFDFSIISYIIVLLLIIYGLIKITKQDIKTKQFFMFFAWFALPLLIGFFYSIYISSVLQYSMLIFSFPFLFFVMFGHIKNQSIKINLLIVFIILSTNIYSVIVVRKHYYLFYKSPFEQIFVDYKNAISSYKDIVSIIDSDKDISDYYIKKTSYDRNFIWFDSFKTEKELTSFLEKQSKTKKYLYLGCLYSNLPNTIPIIQEYFPTIELQKNYVNGTTFIFSTSKQKETNIIDIQDFESDNKKNWGEFDKNKFTDSISFSEKHSFLIDENVEWSPSYARILNEMVLNENNFIDISVKVLSSEKLNDVSLVASLETKDSTLYWINSPFNRFFGTDSLVEKKWVTIFLSLKLSDLYFPNPKTQLKTYIWNKSKQRFYIDDFKIKLRKGNPVIYGLYEKF
ncbi:MAG: glycosyltransferase family 39 protein [Bacteroidetes bacterium]|nr:glycosyltransferase family 39 protein [Bacteroidota bacterium]